MANTSDSPLRDTLDAILDETSGESVKFGKLIDAAQERGYGPLIAFLSAFAVLPTGAIPGVPAIVGLCLILLGLQMAIGRPPWFPGRLKQIEIPSEKLHAAFDKAKGWVSKIESFVKPRIEGLCNGPIAKRVTALCIVACGAVMIPLGFIPFAPLVLGLTGLTLGIGIAARDGVWTIAGYLLFAVGGYVAYQGSTGMM